MSMGTSPSPTLRVLIVAADPFARGGLAALVEDAGSLAVAGQSAPEDIANAMAAFEVDVVVWDLGQDPVRAAAELPAHADDVRPVVVLVDDVTMAAQLWNSGVRGLLHRDVSAPHLGAALQAAADGSAVLDEGFAERLLPRVERTADPVEPLTPREQEVLALLAEGYANKEIGAILEVSENTVKFHVNAILGKLDAQSRTEAVTRAMRLGLLVL